jgi:fatty acid desaturase
MDHHEADESTRDSRGQRRARERRRGLAWLLVALAVVALAAGVAFGQGLLVAAGLVLLGVIGSSLHR